MARFDVTTIGEGNLRLWVPSGQRLETVSQFNVSIAGAEANVTGALSRLGWSCGWVSSLPNTPLGRRILNEYRQTGLDMSAVVWSDQHRMATLFVEYAVPPRSTQVLFDRANSCFANLTPEEIDWTYLLDTRLLHLTGITASLSPSCRQILTEIVGRAREKNIPVSIDVNYRERLWSAAKAAEALTPLIQGADLLFCGQVDAHRIFGCRGAPREIVCQLADLSQAKRIVVSLAGDGIVAQDEGRWYEEPAREVGIVDRIGAGDALAAGVIHGWLQDDFAKGLRYGTMMAALALSQVGEIVITTRAELDALLTDNSQDIIR